MVTCRGEEVFLGVIFFEFPCLELPVLGEGFFDVGICLAGFALNSLESATLIVLLIFVEEFDSLSFFAKIENDRNITRKQSVFVNLMCGNVWFDFMCSSWVSMF